MPLQSVAVQSAVRAAMDVLSFPNFNEHSCRDPPISQCRRRGGSDGSYRRYRVPLLSTKAQGAVYATMDSA